MADHAVEFLVPQHRDPAADHPASAGNHAGIIQADEALMHPRGVAGFQQVGVGAEDGFAGRIHDAAHRVLRAMRDVHHDAALVHAANRMGTELCQAAMHGRFRLDVAGFIDQIMGELDGAHAAFPQFVQPIQIAFQEIAAFHRQNQGRIGGGDFTRFTGDAHAGGLERG